MRPTHSLLRAFACALAPQTLKAPSSQHIPAPAKRLLHTLRTSPVTRPSPVLARARAVPTCRCESTSSGPKPATSTTAPESRLDREQVPSYELTFTCNVCKTRSSHRLSKQGYHHGTILISCPDCKNRHLISDHLKVGLAHGSPVSSKADYPRFSQTSRLQSKTSCGKRAIWSKRDPSAQRATSSSGTMAAPRLDRHISIQSRSPRATSALSSNQHRRLPRLTEASRAPRMLLVSQTIPCTTPIDL
jgi:hypothetical protein